MLPVIRNVVCGISGGVDSAVAALLLRNKGYNVLGLFMKNWDLTNETGVCSGDQDREDAQYVCSHLNIPFHEVSFVKEYWNEVFCRMVQGYESGQTPNPDVLCNRHIKFGVFFDHAMKHLGADAVATGHYAQNSAGRFLQHPPAQQDAKLLMPVDQTKDQTLFLCQISQRALQRTMFPVGCLRKEDVKEMARKAGLERIVKKKESMGICFIGSRNFCDFIEEYIEPKEGNFVDIETGKVVGRHKGTHYWTVGQRCLIGGLRKGYFVAEVNTRTQDIYVAMGTDHPALFSQSLVCGYHWINKPPAGFDETGRATSKFRFQHLDPLINCTMRQLGTNKIEVVLERPLRALTLGQYAVFYADQECLGGGQITEIGPSLYHLNCGTTLQKMEREGS